MGVGKTKLSDIVGGQFASLHAGENLELVYTMDHDVL